jgi:hypothetical protein
VSLCAACGQPSGGAYRCEACIRGTEIVGHAKPAVTLSQRGPAGRPPRWSAHRLALVGSALILFALVAMLIVANDAPNAATVARCATLRGLQCVHTSLLKKVTMIVVGTASWVGSIMLVMAFLRRGSSVGGERERAQDPRLSPH